MKEILIDDLIMNAMKVTGLIKALYEDHPEIGEMTIHDFFPDYPGRSDEEIAAEVYQFGCFQYYSLDCILETAKKLDSSIFIEDVKKTINLLESFKRQPPTSLDEINTRNEAFYDLLLITADCAYWCIVIGYSLDLEISECMDAVGVYGLLDIDIPIEQDQDVDVDVDVEIIDGVDEDDEFFRKEFPGELGVDFNADEIVYGFCQSLKASE